MKILYSFALVIALCSFGVQSHAGVPQLISYQGRVTVANKSFTGAGQFKFAFVGADGAPSFWSNDGVSTDGSEPKYSVPINVLNGLFSILLGDDMLPNMFPIPPTVFTNSHVALRIWFNDGTNAFARLAPDQRISAVGYAMIAESVPDGSITSTKLADGAVTAAKLTDASITSAKLAPGAVSSNLMSSGQSGVGSGGIVFSLDANSASLMSIGFRNIGSMPWNQEHWQIRANGPGPRFAHTMVWSGAEMLAWGGGVAGQFLNTGGRYNPATDSWQPITTTGAPAGRWFHQAVWTGTEMLVWGGRAAFSSSQSNQNDGGRYNPVSDTWSFITTNDAPQRRSIFVAVWSGTEMLVWGGATDGGASLATGSRYNPASNSWRPISENGAPVPRTSCVAVWTGTEMIVWGG
ncbi:MAG TPA: galactose oxidase, partial [Candidatus Eisenbacteria bacterium]|nr:galactose oxidase [Candidatus Eisenbacteria bacterium]